MVSYCKNILLPLEDAGAAGVLIVMFFPSVIKFCPRFESNSGRDCRFTA